MDDRQRNMFMGGFAVLAVALAAVSAVTGYVDGERTGFDAVILVIFSAVLTWQWYGDRFKRRACPEIVDGWFVLAMMALLIAD